MATRDPTRPSEDSTCCNWDPTQINTFFIIIWSNSLPPNLGPTFSNHPVKFSLARIPWPLVFPHSNSPATNPLHPSNLLLGCKSPVGEAILRVELSSVARSSFPLTVLLEYNLFLLFYLHPTLALLSQHRGEKSYLRMLRIVAPRRPTGRGRNLGRTKGKLGSEAGDKHGLEESDFSEDIRELVQSFSRLYELLSLGSQGGGPLSPFIIRHRSLLLTLNMAAPTTPSGWENRAQRFTPMISGLRSSWCWALRTHLVSSSVLQYLTIITEKKWPEESHDY